MVDLRVILAIYIITFLIGFPSNLLSLYTFLRKVRQKPAPIDILLLNLTLSDVMLLVFLPLKMTEASRNNAWPFATILCTFTSCTFHSSIYISALFLTAISVDRYLGVAFPIKYKLNRKLAYATMASIFIWLLVGSHCSAVFVVWSLRNDSTEQESCYMEFNEKQKAIIYPFRLELCLVLFCIPFVITFFCYANVIRILAKLPNVQPHRKQRAVGLALVTLLNYALCFGPFNISHIFGAISHKDPSWRTYTFALSSFNTCLDPFIFFFSSKAIRQNVRVCWAGVCRRFRPIVSRCALPRCKEPRDNEEGAGAVGLSSSSEPGGIDASTQSSSCGHVAKIWKVSTVDAEQDTYCAKFQGHMELQSQKRLVLTDANH